MYVCCVCMYLRRVTYIHTYVLSICVEVYEMFVCKNITFKCLDHKPTATTTTTSANSKSTWWKRIFFYMVFVFRLSFGKSSFCCKWKIRKKTQLRFTTTTTTKKSGKRKTISLLLHCVLLFFVGFCSVFFKKNIENHH